MPIEEEESSDSSSYSEEEEEEQKEKKTTAVTSPMPTRSVARRGTTAAVPPSSSSSSSDSEEESEDDDEDSEDERGSEPLKSQPGTPVGSQKALQSKAVSPVPSSAKPLNSKPMDSKTTVKPSQPASQAKPKRPADSSKEDESKKKKKKKKNDEEELEAEDLAAEVEAKKEDKPDGSKTPQDRKKLFQRVWDAEDEINLLTTLFHYTKDGGHAHDLNGFFNFSRKDLEKFKKTQLQDKVRKLKKRYENVVAKEKKSGKTTTFKSPHEQEAFSLSQLIWGEKGEYDSQKEANEQSRQKSPTKNNDGEEKKLNNNRTNVLALKREEPHSSVSKDENHVRLFENMEIGVGMTKEDELGSTVVNMVEVVDKWIKLADQSKVKDLQERQRKLEGRLLEIHSEHLEIASARAKLALEAFKTSKAGRSRQ
ncbi:probable transcription factor At4g00390 [Nymphaea colorata]|uniref:probable transcription factor At4g00390 n=1 Tax=Nymphaea colorata TaxID=210225 RepID=UPI00129EC3DD|nr:probable transcription factor At4g00390 [Nymphaea colorata]